MAFISQVSGAEMFSTLSPKHLISFSAKANVAREANKIRADFMIDFGRNGDVMMLKRFTELTVFEIVYNSSTTGKAENLEKCFCQNI